MDLNEFRIGSPFRMIDNDTINYRFDPDLNVIKATDQKGKELFYCLVLAESSKGVSTMSTGLTGRRTVLFFAFNQFIKL